MYEEYINKKFNKWIIKQFSHKDKFNHPFFDCECECGTKNKIDLFALKYGKTKCCRHCSKRAVKHGCLKKNNSPEQKRLYSIWSGMKQRCYNKSATHFKSYGGRGIEVCDEWKDNFESFYNWAIKNNYSEDLTLDRKDYDKGYYPENCRWATQTEQANNKRTNRILEYKNKKYTVSQFIKEFNLDEELTRQRINVYKITNPEELLRPSHYTKNKCKIFVKIGNKEQSLTDWCRELNVSSGTIRNRINKYGYTLEEALTTPLKNGKKNNLLFRTRNTLIS